MIEPKWGPIGKQVYERTYSRTKADGTKETWEETVRRVVKGNVSLVDKKYILPDEEETLFDLIYNFKMIPGGRHLWASGVPGRQFLFNCVSAGFLEHNPEYHFTFLFEQLMQGSGVGTNYSNRYIGNIKNKSNVNLHIVCVDTHPDYEDLEPYLSKSISPDWDQSITVEDSREGWVNALHQLLSRTFSEGFSDSTLVLDMTSIRGKGTRIKGFGGVSSGPIALVKMLVSINDFLNSKSYLSSVDIMYIDHLIASCVIAGNVRRSARIAIKSWKDFDITEFIECKMDGLNHWTSNLSVEVDDDFFIAWKKKDHHARRVFENVISAMIKNGEPGFWNIDRNRDGEADPEAVFSANPCGEITLEQWENCNLGSVNLGADFKNESEMLMAFTLMARFLIRATFGDITNDKQREVVQRNRRIGVGVFGYQTWCIKNGVRFSESAHSTQIKRQLSLFSKAVNYEADSYAFSLRIPRPVKTTTVAPTGTTAMLCGETTGLQPIYTRYGIRRVRFSNDDPNLEELRKTNEVEDDIYSPNTSCVKFYYKDMLVELAEKLWGNSDLVEQQNEIHLSDMMAVQAMVQQYYADNAISFTANIEEGSVTEDELKSIMIQYLPKLKGTTIMVDSSRPQMPFERITKESFLQKNGEIGQGDLDCHNGACPIK